MLNSIKTAIATCTFAIASVTVSSVHAQNIVNLDDVDSFSLSLPRQSVTLLVNYPGPNLSGICSIAIVAESFVHTNPISDFISKVKVESIFGAQDDPRNLEIVSRSTAIISLIPGTYVDGISIATRSDETLEEAIIPLRGGVEVLPRSCTNED